jgi:hypothetical protein
MEASRILVPSSFGPVSYGSPALIMFLAALGRLFGAAFALPRPDALSPHPTAPVLCRVARCVRVHQHMIPDDMSIPSPASLALSGRGFRAPA